MKTFRFLFVGLLVSLFGVDRDAHAGLIIASDQLYLDRANNHPYVGFVEGDGSFWGSGVLIHQNWVLMSAHQGTNAFGSPVHPPIYNQYGFGLGSNQINNRGEVQLAATELFIHPSYRGIGLGGSGYDLALMYFENPFLSVAPVGLYQGTVVGGIDSDIVGFGNVQMVNTAQVDFTGDRRAGNNVTRVSGSSLPEFFQTNLRDSSSSTFRPLGMGGRPGDSGGGLFIKVPLVDEQGNLVLDGNGNIQMVSKLAGIVSGGSSSNIFDTLTSYSRLDRDWINSTISLHSTSVPEPGSFVLLLFASSSLVRSRWRRN